MWMFVRAELFMTIGLILKTREGIIGLLSYGKFFSGRMIFDESDLFFEFIVH
jgi:hypothetical protein